jgi:quinol-cytochrome oxidoreductase complex cytochrome b subunit
VGVVFLHLWALHRFGSNNPLGIDAKGPQDKIPFNPYYTVKDAFGLGVFLIFFAAFVFFAPNYMGHPDNYIEANPLVTPPHIVPEWYFLPFYAMLRAVTFDISIPFTGIILIEAKLGGVIVMFASIIILFFLPWLDSSPVRSGRFRPTFKWFFWILAIDLVALGYLGSKPAEQPYVAFAQIATAYYFFHFLILLPLLGKLERPKPLPTSISEPVLKGGGMMAGAAAKPMEKP